MDMEKILGALDSVEKSLEKMSQKAEAEAKANGQVSQDTKTALENIGVSQRELADRLVALEQRSVSDLSLIHI